MGSNAQEGPAAPTPGGLPDAAASDAARQAAASQAAPPSAPPSMRADSGGAVKSDAPAQQPTTNASPAPLDMEGISDEAAKVRARDRLP